MYWPKAIKKNVWIRPKGRSPLPVYQKGCLALEAALVTFSPKVSTKNLVDVGLIREVKCPTWVINIVLVRKENGHFPICIDFRYLNDACPKDPVASHKVHDRLNHMA